MKVFITGATGLIGSFLAKSLLEKKYQVCCLVRKQSNLQWIADLDVECYYGSLYDINSLKQALKDCDYVYHVAGVTKAFTEKEYIKGNFETTKNLFTACSKVKIKLKRFVYISSQAAVGPSPTLIPIDEDFPANPVSYYGKSKLAAEHYLNELKEKIKIPVTIIRPPAVYGPRDKDMFEFFRIVRSSIIPKMRGRERYVSLIHVHDLVKGIITAGENIRAKGETYFITNPKPYAQEEIIKITSKIYKKKGIRISIPVSFINSMALLNEGVARINKKNSPPAFNRQKVLEMKQHFWTCSADKAKRDLNFESEINLEKGIKQTLEWYREYKWLNW